MAEAGAPERKKAAVPRPRAKSPNAAKAAPVAEPQSPLLMVAQRNAFYRDGYRKVARLNILLGIALLLAIAGLVADITLRRPQDRYFLSDQTGRIVPIVAVSQPFVTRSIVLDRAVKGLTSAYTFTFRTWRSDVMAAADFFTDSGFDALLVALDQQQLFATVEKEFLNSTAVIDGAPVVIQEGLTGDGRYSWVVQFHMQHTLQAMSRARTTRYLVEVTMVRVPVYENPAGVAIQQVVTTLRNLK